MRLSLNNTKYNEVIEEVKKYKDVGVSAIEDYIDGGSEGWDDGDKEQQKWLDTADADEIADWVIAGLD